MLELNQLYNMDCMEGMAQFPDKYFELAIVDPPYGIGAGKEKPHNGWKDYGIKQWDNESPNNKYFQELFRVSQNQILWGANYMTDNLKPSQGWIFWDKGQRDFSLADGELAWTSFNRALRVFTFSRAKLNIERGIHPTQKPVALYKWLLANYAKPCDKILDTHVGSASSLIACHDYGYQYIGFELDKDYFEAAQKRLARHKAQPTIFEMPVESAAIQSTMEGL
jgi:site-specific DNA-methyltransferase (adenine-specific)